MNERDAVIFAAIARWTSPHGSTAEDAIGYAEKYFIPAARKRGLFEPAPDAGEAREQLAAVVRESDQLGADLDAAKALLREMAEFFAKARSSIGTPTPWYIYRDNLIARAKEMTND